MSVVNGKNGHEPVEQDTEKFAATHDLGGQTPYQCDPVDPDDDIPPDAFGRRVDALRLVLGAKQYLGTDELRRSIESIPRERYHQLQYYERWLYAVTAILQEKGVVTAEELL